MNDNTITLRNLPDKILEASEYFMLNGFPKKDWKFYIHPTLMTEVLKSNSQLYRLNDGKLQLYAVKIIPHCRLSGYRFESYCWTYDASLICPEAIGG